MRLVGIDPGLKGALAFFDLEANTLTCYSMPTVTEQRSKGMKSFLDEGALSKIVRDHRPTISIIEDVFSSEQMGVVSAFSFGEGKGILKGVLAAHDCERHYVSPSVWKGDLACTADKNQTKRVAKLLLPKCLKILTNEGKCEAALIGLWGCLQLGLSAAGLTA